MSRRSPLREALALALASLAVILITPIVVTAASVLIDFETIPGGTPSNGLAISNQFPRATFSIEGGGSPVLADVGGVPTGFYGPPTSTGFDDPAAGANLGNFFLTDDGVVNQMPKVVLITFTDPVASVGGDVLDVDAGEMWTAEIRDQNGQLIDSRTLVAGDTNTGDGVASPVLFSLPGNEIGSLRFTYAGENQLVGFGFDNLTASNFEVGAVPIPLPPAVWTGLATLGGIWVGGAVLRVRRRHRGRA